MRLIVPLIGFVVCLPMTAGRESAPIPSPASPQSYRAVPHLSELVLHTRKAGLLGFLGDEHGVLATAWRMELCLDPNQLEASRISLMVLADSLVIDSPAARRAAGLDPDDGPGPETVAELQEKMLGPSVLDTERYPTIRFRSRQVRADGGDDLEVTGAFELHGRSREIELPITIRRLPGDTLLLSGATVIRHSDYGMEPESTAGVVKVADEMDLRVLLAVVPEGQACPQDQPAPPR